MNVCLSLFLFQRSIWIKGDMLTLEIIFLFLKEMRGRRKRLEVRNALGFGCWTFQTSVATHLLNNTSDEKEHSSARNPFISLHIWQEDCESWLVINNYIGKKVTWWPPWYWKKPCKTSKTWLGANHCRQQHLYKRIMSKITNIKKKAFILSKPN